MSETMEALASAGLVSPAATSAELHTEQKIKGQLYPALNDAAEAAKENEQMIDDAHVKLTAYPTLTEMQSIIEEQPPNAVPIIKPPSIEPLKQFIEKRSITIESLKQLRIRMNKHITHCKISNTVGNSASIIGGILCFVFPPVGVPVLLAGSATSLGTSITESVIEKRLRNECTAILEADSLAMKVCESTLKDITTWLITVYSLGYSVSKAGINFLKLSEAIQAATTLGTWTELIGQLPSLASALATGAKTAGRSVERFSVSQ